MITRNLAVGDIFHAERPNGIRLICLAISVSEATIRARSVTNDQHFEFDRQTGTGIVVLRGEQHPCSIYSTAPLPVDIHNVILGFDRKFRLEEDVELLKLNEDEKRALLYVAKHYSSKPT